VVTLLRLVNRIYLTLLELDDANNAIFGITVIALLAMVILNIVHHCTQRRKNAVKNDEPLEELGVLRICWLIYVADKPSKIWLGIGIGCSLIRAISLLLALQYTGDLAEAVQQTNIPNIDSKILNVAFKIFAFRIVEALSIGIDVFGWGVFAAALSKSYFKLRFEHDQISARSVVYSQLDDFTKTLTENLSGIIFSLLISIIGVIILLNLSFLMTVMTLMLAVPGMCLSYLCSFQLSTLSQAVATSREHKEVEEIYASTKNLMIRKAIVTFIENLFFVGAGIWGLWYGAELVIWGSGAPEQVTEQEFLSYIITAEIVLTHGVWTLTKKIFKFEGRKFPC